MFLIIKKSYIMQKSQPVVGIVINERMINNSPTYTLSSKYVTPVFDIVKATPVLLPPLLEQIPIVPWLEFLDGLLLTGATSDVHPSNYGDEIKNLKSYFDHSRDRTSLGLIKEAVKQKIPVLGICRGFQEINVALGGTLHQSIHKIEGFFDHREPENEAPDINYGHRHSVTTIPAGKLRRIVNQEKFSVNSLHDQGVDRLANTLQVEAYAEDGLIEAFSLKDSDQFLLATQWHIEWKPHQDPYSKAILHAFGNACIEHHNKRRA